jgi:hypothetical protein
LLLRKHSPAKAQRRKGAKVQRKPLRNAAALCVFAPLRENSSPQDSKIKAKTEKTATEDQVNLRTPLSCGRKTHSPPYHVVEFPQMLGEEIRNHARPNQDRQLADVFERFQQT